MNSNKDICTDFTLHGPNATHIVLVSKDGHEFIVPRKFLIGSITIMNMLMGPGKFSSDEANKVNLFEFSSHALQKLCHYFSYKARYENQDDMIPEFDIKPEVVFELLTVADFLKC